MKHFFFVTSCQLYLLYFHDVGKSESGKWRRHTTRHRVTVTWLKCTQYWRDTFSWMELFSSSTVCLKSLFRNEFLHLPIDDKDEPKVNVKVLESLRSLLGFTLHWSLLTSDNKYFSKLFVLPIPVVISLKTISDCSVAFELLYIHDDVWLSFTSLGTIVPIFRTNVVVSALTNYLVTCFILNRKSKFSLAS